jgi:hypothetical protein
MGSLLYADRYNSLESEVNRTTEKFVTYYVSALEALHYSSLERDRVDYADKEKKKAMKAEHAISFEELGKINNTSYKRLKLEDLFRPDSLSTALIALFDEVELPYFDEEGKLKHSSPNHLLKKFYEGLYNYGKMIFPNDAQKTMIVKGNALIKRNRTKAHYSCIREEFNGLTDKMTIYFLNRLYRLYGTSNSDTAREYFSIFGKMKMPALEFIVTSTEGSFQDWEGETRRRDLSFGNAIALRLARLYDPTSIRYLSDKEEELLELDVPGNPFAQLYFNRIDTRPKKKNEG